MGLLDKLWDDTLAGPQPDTGLSKLRKPRKQNSAKEQVIDEMKVEVPKVTRSIMIKRPAGCPSPGNGTPPASPAGSTPPVSPFSLSPFSLSPFSGGGGSKEMNRFRRKSLSDAYERGADLVGVESRSPRPRPPNEV